MNYKWEDFKKKFKAWLQPILDYIDSFLNTKAKKILFASAVVATILLSAYIIALFDVGLSKWPPDFSVGGILSAYRGPKYAFPWGVFLVFVLVILLVAAMIIYKYGYPTGGRNFKVSRSDVYGSSKELTRKELTKVAVVTDKMATTKTILGQFDEVGKEVIAAKPAGQGGSITPNDNQLVFGPPGSGKSTSYVLPFIAQAILRRHSVVASDTKGEVYAKTVELARRHGYRVLRLDLKDPEHSDGWNVLKELRHDDVRSLIFAQTVMANTNTEGSKDPHAGAEESLLNAVCLYTERYPKLKPEERTFHYAYSLLLLGAEKLDALMNNAGDEFPEEMQIVMEAYGTFLHGSQNLRGNVISNLTNRIKLLSSPPIRRMTSTDDIVFEDIGKEPTILYLSLSDQHATMKFLASLAFSFAFQDLVHLADHSPNQRLPIPVHFMLEEFGSIGYVPNIDRSLSTARSRGISINIVIQTLAQLQETYEDNMTSIILADCATWVLLGCNDKMSAELLEWRSGTATVEVKTTQHDALEPAYRLSHRNSTGDGQRAIYTSNDIIKTQARNEALLIFQQLDPLKAKAFPIFQHHEFRSDRMPEISSESLIPLTNVKAKEIFRKWEAQRVKSFKAWLFFGGNPLREYTGFPPAKRGIMSNKDMPDITNIHSLERMALAKAAGVRYDPTKDPDSPLYEPPENKEAEQFSLDDIWEMDESDFVDITEKSNEEKNNEVAGQKEVPPVQPQANSEDQAAQQAPETIVNHQAKDTLPYEEPTNDCPPQKTKTEDAEIENAIFGGLAGGGYQSYAQYQKQSVDVSDLLDETDQSTESGETVFAEDMSSNTAEPQPPAQSREKEQPEQKEQTPTVNESTATVVAGGSQDASASENEQTEKQPRQQNNRHKGTVRRNLYENPNGNKTNGLPQSPADLLFNKNQSAKMTYEEQCEAYNPKTKMEAGKTRKLSDLQK